jgi:hypothetical protein
LLIAQCTAVSLCIQFVQLLLLFAFKFDSLLALRLHLDLRSRLELVFNNLVTFRYQKLGLIDRCELIFDTFSLYKNIKKSVSHGHLIRFVKFS